MKIEKDYEELLRLLNRHNVKYCIIGSFAVAFYAKPRYTKDIDILIQPDRENSRRILKALQEFGFESIPISEEDFIKEGNIIQLGYEPLRIDILTSLEGASFTEIWGKRTTGMYGSEKVHFIGLKDLIQNKQLSGRWQDKHDLQILEKAARKEKDKPNQ